MFSRFFKSKKSDNPKKDKEISLVVENGTHKEPYSVSVRRSVLTKHSTVFKKMAENGEFKKSREIKLKGITPIGLQKIIEYIKEDAVYFQNHFEAIETLRAAYLYQVQAMHDICSNFLVTVIDSTNVCDIFEFASTYTFHHVEYHCLRFIDRHSEKILQSAAFLTLKKPTVADIVKRQTLNVPSEILVFRAVLTWGINDCLRRGADTENIHEVFTSVKPLLGHIRFLVLTDDELSDPDVDKFHKMLCSEDSSNKRRSFLNLETRSRSSTCDTFCIQAREYASDYAYELEALEFDEHAVRNGESFCMRIEILKGRVFLTGIALAFDRFVNSKNTSCLYAAISATNVQTADQKIARGTFMISNEEAILKFPSPLIAKESERVEVALNVKRAVNICSVIIKSDVQIAIPEKKDVAMKIIPSSTSGGTEKSMFKSIKYFY